MRHKFLLVTTFEQFDKHRLFVAFSSSCAARGATAAGGAAAWSSKDIVGESQYLCG